MDKKGKRRGKEGGRRREGVNEGVEGKLG